MGECTKVVILRFNKNKEVWNIDKAITLLSDITIVLDNCHLRMADGFIGRMFENENIDMAQNDFKFEDIMKFS